MDKKGQVTIFIIIGIIIVFGVVLFFILSGDSSRREGETQVDAEVEPIYNYVGECLDESVEEGIFYVAERGGYESIPENIISEIFEVPYYIKEGEITMISKKELESQLSQSIKQNLEDCVDLSEFSDYEIKSKTPSPEVSIEEERVNVNLYYPIDIRKGENTYKIEDFEETKNIRLGLIYEAISEYIEEQSEINEGFCVSCFYDISQEYDFTVDSFDTSEGSKIFIISDFNSKLNDEELIYSFAGSF